MPRPAVVDRNHARIAAAEESFDDAVVISNRYRGALGWLTAALLVAMSLFHMYAAVAALPARILLPVHVGFTLVLVFLLFPISRNAHNRMMWFDVVGALLGLATIAYLLAGGDDVWNRSIAPRPADSFFGVIFLLLVLEACRRTTGWAMVLVISLFLAYAFTGPWMAPPWQHPGRDVAGLTGFLYQTLDGVFGPAVRGSSTLIILLAVYGAFLRRAGGSIPALRQAASSGTPATAGRTTVIASSLTGASTGSGVATTVQVGSTMNSLLERAGFDKDARGGLLAAAGLGAIIAPPVLGAAAILIVEFVKISYYDVLLMASIPAMLFFLSLLLTVKIQACKNGLRESIESTGHSPGELLRRSWRHVASLLALVVFMWLGATPVHAVLYAMALTVVLSFLQRDTAIGMRKLWSILQAGSRGMLKVAATCAGAGIIVGVVAATGLGPGFSAVVIGIAGGSLPVIALGAALMVLVIGLLVPTTASYIIGAVLMAPALITLGVPDFAAHLFIFYVAAFAQVMPFTGPLPRAATDVTGGDPRATALRAGLIVLPALVLPFAIVLDPAGLALLLKVPTHASWGQVAWMSFMIVGAVAVLTAGVQNWLLRACTPFERWILIGCGLLLVGPLPWLRAVGFIGVLGSIAWQWRGLRRAAASHAIAPPLHRGDSGS